MSSALPASRIEIFEVLIPAGTPKAAPLVTQTAFLPGELVGVEIIFPDGPNYSVGVQILAAGGQAIPHTPNTYIVTNDEKVEWPTLGYPNSGAYSVQGYNTDLYDHTIRVRYLISDFVYNVAADAPAPVPTPLAV